MQLEQPAELNRVVDPTIPLTWRKRWELTKLALPLLVVCGVIMAELAAFRLWLNDRNLLAYLPILLLALLAPAALYMGTTELTLRINHWTKRRLELGTQGIRITHSSYGNIPWKWVKRWVFAPVPDRSDIAKATVEYTIDKKGKRLRAWSIVLTQPEQTHALKSQLNHLAERGITAAPVIELPEPAAFLQKPYRLRGVIQLALAFYLFIHGLLLLMTGIPPTEKTARESAGPTLTETQQKKLGRFMARHFPSKKEFRRFSLPTGAALTALSVVFYGWGMAVARKGSDSAQNNVTSTESPQ